VWFQEIISTQLQGGFLEKGFFFKIKHEPELKLPEGKGVGSREKKQWREGNTFLNNTLKKHMQVRFDVCDKGKEFLQTRNFWRSVQIWLYPNTK